jgi:hypothetical protein
MKKNLFILLCFFTISNWSFSQPGNVTGIASIGGDTLNKTAADQTWKKGGFINLTFSQVSLSNWAPGGDNSYSGAANSTLFAIYDKGRIRWDNNLILSYAMQQTGNQGLRKTDDQIDLTSKYGYKASTTSKWYYSALINFKSQFSSGFKYPDDSTVVSKFLAPAYVVGSLGFTWKPLDYFELFVSPVSSRITIVNDQKLADEGRYGVQMATIDANGLPVAGKKIRSQFGAYLNARFRKEIMTNVTLATRLELFNDYTDPNKSNRKNIDVNWETGILMKVNKLITASIIFQVVCDDDVIKKTQYRQVTGIGIGYKF